MTTRFLETGAVKTAIGYAQKYERHVGLGALAGGFIFDTITLGGPGNMLGLFVLGGYLLVSAGCIVALSFYGRSRKAAPVFFLLFLQFCFGNIAGGLLVLYGQSGTFEGSFLFFAVIGVFVISNEFLRRRYALLNFHIGAWFFLALAYASFSVPVLVKQMGDYVFIGGILFAAAAVWALLSFVYFVSPKGFIDVRNRTLATLGGIGVFFVGLYFFNIIPPVPLSLNQIGIYHSITRVAEGYEVTFEKPRWYEFFRETHKLFAAPLGERAYCFSSVRAPIGLQTSVYHRWEMYDEMTGEWKTAQALSFPIAGGRALGYRGYTEKEVSAGKWRCSAETFRGALIGRTTFRVIDAKDKPPLSSAKL